MHAVAAGVALTLAIALSVLDASLILGLLIGPHRVMNSIGMSLAGTGAAVGGYYYLLRKPCSTPHVVLRGSILNAPLLLVAAAVFLHGLLRTGVDTVFSYLALFPVGALLLACLILGTAASRALAAAPVAAPSGEPER